MPYARVRRMSIALAGGAMAACAGVAPAPHGVRPATSPMRAELTEDEQARHVLSRLAFGPRPGDVERVKAMGVDRWMAQQLSPEQINDAEMDRVLQGYATIASSAGQLQRDFPPPLAALVRQRLRGDSLPTPADSGLIRRSAAMYRSVVGDLLSARVARAVASERQLQEVMTDFWLNHFNVFVGKNRLRYYLPAYERAAIRPHTLGRFRDLLGAVAHSPAMLLYLDNAQSVADSTRATLGGRGARDTRDAKTRRTRAALDRRRSAMTSPPPARLPALPTRRARGLNENYARELLELHSLGVDGGYTQHDVIDVARALTGWTVRPSPGGEPVFTFNAASHDAEEKVVLGTRLRAGRGIEDGEQVLDLIARHPSTARFVARKLVVRFVSDSPPPSLVERASATFVRTDGDLRAVVRTIVMSPEFRARAAYRAKVKSPFEVVVSAARALGAGPDTTGVSSLHVARLGQPIYGHQAPNGWPETGAAWMNTGAILGRINFGLIVASNRVPGARLAGWPAYAQLRTASHERQVAEVIDAFLGGVASPETRELLLTGENPVLTRGRDAARDSLALPADDAPSDTMSMVGTERPERRDGKRIRPPPQLRGLDQLVGLALGSPEFQRR